MQVLSMKKIAIVSLTVIAVLVGVFIVLPIVVTVAVTSRISAEQAEIDKKNGTTEADKEARRLNLKQEVEQRKAELLKEREEKERSKK